MQNSTSDTVDTSTANPVKDAVNLTKSNLNALNTNKTSSVTDAEANIAYEYSDDEADDDSISNASASSKHSDPLAIVRNKLLRAKALRASNSNNSSNFNKSYYLNEINRLNSEIYRLQELLDMSNSSDVVTLEEKLRITNAQLHRIQARNIELKSKIQELEANQYKNKILVIQLQKQLDMKSVLEGPYKEPLVTNNQESKGINTNVSIEETEKVGSISKTTSILKPSNTSVPNHTVDAKNEKYNQNRNSDVPVTTIGSVKKRVSIFENKASERNDRYDSSKLGTNGNISPSSNINSQSNTDAISNGMNTDNEPDTSQIHIEIPIEITQLINSIQNIYSNLPLDTDENAMGNGTTDGKDGAEHLNNVKKLDTETVKPPNYIIPKKKENANSSNLNNMKNHPNVTQIMTALAKNSFKIRNALLTTVKENLKKVVYNDRNVIKELTKEINHLQMLINKHSIDSNQDKNDMVEHNIESIPINEEKETLAMENAHNIFYSKNHISEDDINTNKYDMLQKRNMHSYSKLYTNANTTTAEMSKTPKSKRHSNVDTTYYYSNYSLICSFIMGMVLMVCWVSITFGTGVLIPNASVYNVAHENTNADAPLIQNKYRANRNIAGGLKKKKDSTLWFQ